MYHHIIIMNLIIISPNQVLGFSKKNSMLGKIPQKSREY